MPYSKGKGILALGDHRGDIFAHLYEKVKWDAVLGQGNRILIQTSQQPTKGAHKRRPYPIQAASRGFFLIGCNCPEGEGRGRGGENTLTPFCPRRAAEGHGEHLNTF